MRCPAPVLFASLESALREHPDDAQKPWTLFPYLLPGLLPAGN